MGPDLDPLTRILTDMCPTYVRFLEKDVFLQFYYLFFVFTLSYYSVLLFIINIYGQSVLRIRLGFGPDPDPTS
jgi:hypothetical protein